MTALELSPFMHIAHDLVSVAQRINSCREASTRLAHGMQDAPASQQGQVVERATHGVLPAGALLQPQTSLGWPRDGEYIQWDSDRLACVWRYVQHYHIQQGGQRPDLEGLAGELGLRHPQHRYNGAIRVKYLYLACKFDDTGEMPLLDGGRPKRDCLRRPFRLSDKIRQILASMPDCEGSYEDIIKALEQDPQVIPHIDRHVCHGFK